MTADTPTRRRFDSGLPADPSVRRRLLTWLWWGAALAVPAGGLILTAYGLLIATNPSWWAAQTPASAIGYFAEWFWLGAGIGFVVSAGAVIALIIYAARGGQRNRPGVAALGAVIGPGVVGLVLDASITHYMVFLIIAVFAALVGSGLAAAYVGVATAAAYRDAYRRRR